MGKKSSVYGIGINDANYEVSPRVDGRQIICPYYAIWKRMLSRCYCQAVQTKQPTYIGCSVCEEWLSFMPFRAWMMRQAWQGKHLDKDIITPGNRIYCPEKCRFVSPELNGLLNNRRAARGKWPQGVTWAKLEGKFKARVMMRGKDKYLGSFDRQEEAELIYLKTKAAYIREIADEQTDIHIYCGLHQHAKIYDSKTSGVFSSGNPKWQG